MKEKFQNIFRGDTTIWVIIFLLSIVSMLTVYSATGTLAYKKMGGNTMFYLIKHAGFLFVGIGITWFIHKLIPYYLMRKLTMPLLYGSVALLLFTLFSGVSLNSAARWVSIGGIQFQSSDLAKIALVLYVARTLATNQDNIDDKNAVFWPIVRWIAIICLLIAPANLSTAAMLAMICFIMMFIGRINIKSLLALCGSCIAIVALLLVIALAMPQVREIGRIGTWLGRVETFAGTGEHNDAEHSFQSDHAKMAIVHGGIIGQGPGNSVQRNFLPHPYSDFIYAIIIEEYGIIGGTAVLVLYIVLLNRVRKIVKGCRSSYAVFLCIGLAVSLVIQALINMGVAVNIFPVTGQTLPLMSMGGTSIIFTSISIGIILNISRYAEGGDLAEPQAAVGTADIQQ